MDYFDVISFLHELMFHFVDYLASFGFYTSAFYASVLP